MTWAAQSAGGWKNTGAGGPSLWAFATKMTGTGSLVLQMIDPAKPVGIWIYGDALGTTRYEIIASAGTGGNIILNKWIYGTITGSSPLATAAHGLTDGDSYTLEVRWVNGVITAYLNGSTTALWTYDTMSDLGTNTAMGFASSTDGAMVAGAKIYVLTQVFASLADVFWAIIGGTLFASDSGRGGIRAIGTFLDPTVRVIGTEYHQTALIIDGSKVIKFDAAAMTAAPHIMAAGKLPGQTALNDPSGQTTAKFVLAYNDRVLWIQDQYAIATAIGTDDDADLTTDNDGKAFVWPAQVGEPLLGGIVTTDNRLVLWARRSMWQLSAEPLLGGQISRLSDNIGGSGPNSACMVSGGTIFLHSDQGAMIIPAGGNPVPLSRDVLTDIIEVEGGADNLMVSVVRDTKRHGIWILLTTADGTSQAKHIWYDERTGRFQPAPDPLSGTGGGGFWPQQFADANTEPTCACRYNGEVIVGTRDGRLLFFDEAAQGQDDGIDFTSTIALQMVHPEDLEQGILLRNFALAMGQGSADTDLEVVGGESPERAFGDTAWTLWTETMRYVRNSFSPSVSAPAIVLKLSCTGGAFALERCQVEFKTTLLMPDRRLPALAGAAICAPPVTSSGGGSTPPAPGPGDGVTPPSGGGGGPGTCTLCADWMTVNKTGTVDGHDAFQLSANADWSTMIDAAYAALDNVIAQNICVLPEKADIQIHVKGSVTSYTQNYAIQAANPQLDTPFTAYFRCFDQPGV